MRKKAKQHIGYRLKLKQQESPLDTLEISAIEISSTKLTKAIRRSLARQTRFSIRYTQINCSRGLTPPPPKPRKSELKKEIPQDCQKKLLEIKSLKED